MNKKQRSIFAMQRRVYDFFTRNLDFLSTLPQFLFLYNLFGGNIVQINVLNEKQEKDITGLTQKKVTLRAAAFKAGMNLQRRLLAFAKLTNNEVLTKEISYTETDMSHYSDDTFLSATSVIYSAGVANQEAANGYGVTTELLTEVKSSIDGFSVVIDLPKEGLIEKTQTYGQLEDLLHENQTKVLAKTDLLLDTVKDSHAALYKEYYDTRKIVTRSGSLTVKAVVTDAQTNTPIVGAVVSFRLDGVLMLEKISAEAGGFNIKSMEEGNYEVTTTKIGYQTDVREVIIVANELNSVTVSLKKPEAKKISE